ncbi:MULTISPECIES: ABC transporter ATP-binding protein [Devosia]|uniref:Multidrug export ATP-binding/permease protein n=1 Tax=Devosia equisanguinis TaxID=2490941 RepID=A0A447ICP1_9HYPH|nr:MULTISPECIES: ABC transporter ATP-binding protein [Devosia]ODT47362.1 MAG: multidrug ABC transporter ATP-binding protein [Pelagibacterium sp. SCN 63-126]ODU87039.1 MAG: multidrug ABC transporter ATP-binding protein [Pelagibacterium sp. SCN 63-17]OJX42930.1 MAG: multidrug ABC transporter ATP-binding protein [Devosia sp. 63-57]VDS05235.1 Putative multidrug export ATP-binding/permease protein [Devosia equisanguinis]
MLRWFESRLNPYPKEDPVEPPKSLLAFCLHYSKGAKRWLALMAVAAAAVAIGEIIIFGFIGDVVNWLAGANPETFLQTDGWKLALMGAMIVFILPAIALVSTLTMHQTLLGNFPQRIRWMSHRYLIRQSMSFFQDEFAGRIGAKLMQTSLAVREVVMKLLDMLVYVVVYFTGAVILAASADWRLAIPFLLWLVAYVAMMFYFIPRMGKISQEQADARSMMTGRIVDSYTNIATVKLFSHSNREETYAKEAMDEFLDTAYRQMRLFTVLNTLVLWSNSLLLAAVGGTGIWLWMQGLMTPGSLAVSLGLVMRFQGMSQWVMWEMSSLFENIGTVRDGISSLSVSRVVSDAPDAKPLPEVKGDIKFENVSFHYGKKGGVIDNLNLHIQPGEKIGLVGRSGAGKSTLVNLLLRFYDRADGRILIDGHDIAKVTQDSLRANIGVVTQDTSLLHRSVRDNIIYGRPDATEEMMLAAADKAEASDFIKTLSDLQGRKGFDAHVGERGVKLSGGQRQRIAIARVLLKNAPILVLDEATSALDSEVEAAIQSQLQMLMDGKTVIAIAHRLSTIAMMDRLVVLDKGRVVEQGSHAQLLETGGIYSQLWQRQSGGFIDADQGEEAAE